MTHLCSINMFPIVDKKRTPPIIKIFPLESKLDAKTHYELTLSISKCPSFIFKTPIPYQGQGEAEMIESYGFKSYKTIMQNFILTLERIGMEVKSRLSYYDFTKFNNEGSNISISGKGAFNLSLYFSLLEDFHASNFSEEIDGPQKIFEEIALKSGSASLFCLKFFDKELRLSRIASSGVWHREDSKILEDFLLKFIDEGYFSF